jgi:hypothetical protein
MPRQNAGTVIVSMTTCTSLIGVSRPAAIASASTAHQVQQRADGCQRGGDRRNDRDGVQAWDAGETPAAGQRHERGGDERHADEQDHAMRLMTEFERGVGYLLKDRVSDLAGFAGDVRRVAGGGCVIDPELVARLVGRTSPQRQDDRGTRTQHLHQARPAPGRRRPPTRPCGARISPIKLDADSGGTSRPG